MSTPSTTPDPFAERAAKKAFEALTQSIDYAVMEDDRPEVYEEALAIFTSLVQRRAQQFRDAKDD